MNRLGGTEETLFERSPGVGREERPPNIVVVQLNQVLQTFCFTVLNYKKNESDCYVKCLNVSLTD